MAIPAITLWADSSRGLFATGWQYNTTAAQLKLKQGDTLGVELHWVETSSGVMKEVLWPASVNITLAIGLIDSAPTGGSYSLSYGTAHTASIAFDATATTIQAALNAIPAIASEGGVVVVKSGTTYRIIWNDAGVVAYSIGVYENDMLPTSSIGIGVARTGSALVSQVYQIHIKQAPVAACVAWTDQDSPAITITQTHAPAYSGDFRVWRLVISPAPQGGTFRLSKVVNGQTYWTAPIEIDGLAAPFIANATGLTVSRISNFEFELSQLQIDPDPTVNISALGADSSGIIGFSSKFGELNLNSLDVEYLLLGANSKDATIELEVEQGGKRQTIVQSAITIVNDLIDTDSYTLVEWGDVIPADSVVRFDTPQALTNGQKSQARTNIGAIDTSALTAYSVKDIELEGRIGNLEVSIPSVNVSAANAPTALNPFSTAADTAVKADIVHTHDMFDINGLDVAINAKADVSHVHLIADVSGLATELSDLTSNKADLTHTHIIANVLGLQGALDNKSDITHTHPGLITGSIGDALTAGESPSTSNAFVTVSAMETYAMPSVLPISSNDSGFSNGGFDTAHYPFEIAVTIFGTVYKIPARIS